MNFQKAGVWLLAGLMVLPWAIPLGAETGHDRFHNVYKNWHTRDGESCCNEQDCSPIEGRVTEKGVEISVNGEWVVVPQSKIRPYASPDGGFHACISPQTMHIYKAEQRIRCVVVPFAA